MVNLHHFSITQHCPDITLYLLLIPSSWVKFQSCVFYICSLCILVPITYFPIPPTHEFPLNTYYLLPNHFIAQLLNHWTLGSFIMYYLLLIAYSSTRASAFWAWPGPCLDLPFGLGLVLFCLCYVLLLSSYYCFSFLIPSYYSWLIAYYLFPFLMTYYFCLVVHSLLFITFHFCVLQNHLSPLCALRWPGHRVLRQEARARV